MKLGVNDLKHLFCLGCIGCNNSHFHSNSEKRGVISAEIIFKQNTTKSLQMLSFKTNHKVISCDSLRSMTIDY